MPARLIRITGRVQGVFFRSSTEAKALSLGLTGWVRNNSDGSVEVFAEGSDSDVQALIVWCRRGPEQARVEEVVVKETAEQHFQGFRIWNNQ